MTDYDRWLEKPYQEAAEKAEVWERMAEEHPDANDTELERLVEEQEEAAAEAEAERRLDARRDA